MTTKPNPQDDGGPAFPVADWDHQTFAPKTIEEVRRLLSGMSLRDYFAAKAMQALITSNDDGAGDRINDIPGYAYDIADAMIRARQESSHGID